MELPNPSIIDESVIIVAHDLTPSDTAQLNKQYVQGFVTNIGGRTSHSAIMSRSLEIPAVVGTKSISESVQQGDMVIVDGLTGMLLLILQTMKSKRINTSVNRSLQIVKR